MKRQAIDTSTDRQQTPKYEMEGNPCYEATVVKQTTDTHLYEAVLVRGGGDKWKKTDKNKTYLSIMYIYSSLYLQTVTSAHYMILYKYIHTIN